MPQSNRERAFVVTVIIVNVIISILLLLCTVYIFAQVMHLQEENSSLQSKWQELWSRHNQNGQKKGTDFNERERTTSDENGDPSDNTHNKKSTTIICCGATGAPTDPPEHDAQPGKDGEKGNEGICGPCRRGLEDSPLLHLTGDGTQSKKISNVESVAVAFWNEKAKAGDITYKNGYLTINVAGYYHIYSQMAYCGRNPNPLRVGHYMSINGKKVLESIFYAKNYATKKIGGLFKLNKGDQITVSPRVTNIEYCFAKEDAYFGAYLVRK